MWLHVSMCDVCCLSWLLYPGKTQGYTIYNLVNPPCECSGLYSAVTIDQNLMHVLESQSLSLCNVEVCDSLHRRSEYLNTVSLWGCVQSSGPLISTVYGSSDLGHTSFNTNNQETFCSTPTPSSCTATWHFVPEHPNILQSSSARYDTVCKENCNEQEPNVQLYICWCWPCIYLYRYPESGSTHSGGCQHILAGWLHPDTLTWSR